MSVDRDPASAAPKKAEEDNRVIQLRTELLLVPPGALLSCAIPGKQEGVVWEQGRCGRRAGWKFPGRSWQFAGRWRFLSGFQVLRMNTWLENAAGNRTECLQKEILLRLHLVCPADSFLVASRASEGQQDHALESHL
jgi:hypothetical protein